MKTKQTFATNSYEIARSLTRQYNNFAHYNKRNPLDELFFILCSVKRNEKVYLEAFRSLRQNFPRYELFATASVHKLSKAVSWGGLQNRKAATAKEIVKRLIESFGRPTLAPLGRMSDKECEDFLTNLPGVGKKVARCVMLYSLGRQVFPVDSHCWRIANRLGWNDIGCSGSRVSETAMDYLQHIIPPVLRFSLHVNMVSHGRKICLARSPKCCECVIVSFCRYGTAVEIPPMLGALS